MNGFAFKTQIAIDAAFALNGLVCRFSRGGARNFELADDVALARAPMGINGLCEVVCHFPPTPDAITRMTTDLPLPGLLAELEARQDEVLAQLDDLERRIETVLSEFTALKLPPAKPRKEQAAAA